MSSRLLIGLLVCLFAVPMVGCGPSQKELMMRSARRKRPSSDDETKEEVKEAAPVAAAASKPEEPTGPPPDARMKVAQEEVAQEEEKEESRPLLTVEELKEQSGAVNPRGWVADNLMATYTALEKYHAEKLHYPIRYHLTNKNLPTLSWRVLLLPYLGYHDLYAKFDLNKPWYMEPNKSLLKYIPKEYVSPERFDTKTNIQLPANGAFMFGRPVNVNQPPRHADVEDGLDDTIMLLEVDDEFAIEWTAPGDFEPRKTDRLKELIGHLREDGTFAMWGNGWPVLLSNECSNKQLEWAFSRERNDGPVSGTIHRPLPVDAVSDASLATAKSDKPAMEAAAPEPEPQPEPIIRESVPIAGEIERAMSRLRQVYATPLKRAVTDQAKAELGSRLLVDAARLEGKPAESYALAVAAEKLAIDAGSATLLIEALDMRVGRFEIDAYQTNIKGLAAFAEGVKRNPANIFGKEEFVDRAILTIFAAITADDYLMASKVARGCARMLAPGRSDTANPTAAASDLPRLMNRLQSQLTSANAQYRSAKEHLITLRIHPDDNDAAAGFGRFLCFVKGDWKMGLPLLIRSSNEDLAEVAKLDVANPKTADEQIAVADGWWELAGRASGVYRQSAEDRALLWYDAAYQQMPESLDRMYVANQINEVNRSTDPTGPIPLCKALAQQLGANLEVSLASIANDNYAARVAAVEDNGGDD